MSCEDPDPPPPPPLPRTRIKTQDSPIPPPTSTGDCTCRCVLLVAFDPDKAPSTAIQAALAAAQEAAAAAVAAAGAHSSSSSSGSSSGGSSSSSGFAGDLQLPEEFSFPRYGYWLSRLVDRPVWPGLGVTHEELGECIDSVDLFLCLAFASNIKAWWVRMGGCG